MFDLTVQWLIVTIDISVKAMVLAAIAVLSLRLLNLHDSNLRHRTWTGVLIGMLLLPVLSQTLPTLQLPVAVPEHWKIYQRDSISPPIASVDTEDAELIAIGSSQESSSSLAIHESSGESGLYRSEQSDHAWSTLPDVGPEAEFGTSSLSPEVTDNIHPTVAELDRDGTEVASITPSLTVQDPQPPLWPGILLAIWLTGAGVMALRLLAGVAYSRRLVWSSTVITSNDLAELGVDFHWLKNERLAMTCECPLIRVPVALGVIRPRILLPSDWNAWSAEKMQAVIAHEQTHIQRADGAVIFLAELNRCLYWFHPVAWWLRSQLGQLAETACDDAAIDCTGDRATYARHLLEVASSVSGRRSRLISVGISMARPSNVETRINAILDFTRPLSKRLTWTTTLLLFGVLVPLITLAAVVQPSSAQTNAQSSAEQSATDDGTAADEAAGPDHITEPETNRNDSLITEEQQTEPMALATGVVGTTITTSRPEASGFGLGEETVSSSQGATPKESVDETALGNDSPVANREVSAQPQSYSGRVETPEGEAIAGAKIWLAVTSYDEGEEGFLHELGAADERGHFQVHLDAATAAEVRRRVPFSLAQLVATAEGRGLDWMPFDVFEDNAEPSQKRDTLQARIDRSLGAGRFENRTLKLRPESQPIRGRLLNLDGHPLPNVTVLVESLSQPDIPLLLKAFEETSKDGFYAAINATGVGVGGLARGELQQLIPPATTDENGEFELDGIGDDQLVTLTFADERVQAQVVNVLGRTMETVRLPHTPFHSDGTKDVYAGRDLTYAVGPAVPVEGVVTDYDTGEPVARTVISVERLFSEGGGADEGQLRLDTRHMRTVTDEQGHFRITGMPPGIGHVLEAVPPRSEPYLMASQNVSLSVDDGDAKEIKIRVKKGIWIEGRVTDKQSGEPLSGTVDYLALQKNPHTLDKLGLKQAWQMQRYRIDSEGRYRTLGLPGPGVVLVQAAGGYPRSVGAESVDGYEAGKGGGYLPTTPTGLPLSNWNFIKQIDPAVDAKSFMCDVELDAGQSVPGRVVGPKGNSIADLNVLGEVVNVPFWKPHAASTFAIEGYDGTGPRQLYFKNKEETLVGQYRLEGDAPKEIVVTLEPFVRVTGRLIENETDLPAQRYGLHCDETSVGKFRIDDCITDDEGNFEIRGLVSGLVYKMNAANPQHFVNNRNRFTIDLTAAKPGDVIELGDVTGPNSNQPGKRPPIDNQGKQAKRTGRSSPLPDDSERVGEAEEKESTAAGEATTKRDDASAAVSYSGQVKSPEGEPIAGAKIWVASSHGFNSEVNRENQAGLLRELGTADAQGRFEVVLDAVTTQEIRKRLQFSQSPLFAEAQLVATVQGRGLDWMPLDVFEDDPAPGKKRDALQTRIDKALGDGRFASRALKLRPQSQSVRGRLVDLQGHPLPKVTVLVESLYQPDIPRLLKALDKSWKREVNEAFDSTRFGVWGLARSDLQRLIPPVTTDENGEFELRGIGDDQLATLIFNSDRVEARPVYVLGREMQTVSLPNDDSNPAGAKDVFMGRDFTYAVGPSVPVEGVVTDYDTGQPVANVLVYVERLFKEGSVNHEQFRLDTCHMRAVTDEQGRFRITGMPPGEGHVLEAVPPMSEPYLMTSQDVSPSLEDGDAKRIEIQVKRGVWIEGRVTDKQSSEPRFATVDYMPLKKNPHALIKLGTDSGWLQQRYATDSDGRYRTLGLPGPGVLLVKSKIPDYPLAAGAETIDGYDAPDGVIPTTFFPLPVSEWHLLKQIDPAADAISSTCDLVLDAGLSIPGRVVGPDGKRISDFYVLGQTERETFWGPRNADGTRWTTDRISVNGYDGIGPRQLFFKNQDETLVGQYRLEGDAPKEIVVTLGPSVRVTGRLIENKTDLPAARYFLSCKECFLPNEKYPPVKFMIHWCHTDDEGRFEIKGLMDGLKYKMYALNESDGNRVGNRFTIDLTAAKPGDVIELGDVTEPDSGVDVKN